MTGEELDIRRIQLGLDRLELATVLHTTPMTIGRWISEKTPVPGLVEYCMDLIEDCEARGITWRAPKLEMRKR